MGLAEEVRGTPVPRWTRAIVDAHLGDEAADFAALLADPLTNLRTLRHALHDRGIMVSEASIQKWAHEARTRVAR